MKKITTLFTLLLLFVATVTAQTTTTWESRSGWTQASGGVANIYWFGATTPGNTSTLYTMSEFQIMQTTTAPGSRYIAIATASSTGSLSESNVVAVSNNAVTPSATALCTYTFDSDVTLTGGTTYYVVFLTSNTPSSGAYTVGQGRIALNHTSYGTYTPGCSNATNSTWWPYFTTELTQIETVNVTYELYDNGTKVNSVEVVQAPNSAVSVPANLTSGYSSMGYDFTTSGEIGSTNCTITVTATPKEGVVTDLANLSNTKVYTIRCERGSLTTQNGSLTSTQKSGAPSAKNFAILNREGSYYLYSVEDEKFVGNDCSLSVYPTPNADFATTPTALGIKPMYKFVFGSKRLNTNANGAVIDNYNTDDGGNCFLIVETGDFSADDLATALAKFTDRTPYYAALAAKIAEAEGMAFGTELGKYTKGSDYEGALTNAQTVYANTDATIEELQTATTTLETAIGNCTLNMPQAGMFLTLKSVHNTYLSGTATTVTVGEEQEQRLSYTTTTDANTIFYFDGSKLLTFGNGLYANGRAVAAVGGEGLPYEFEESTITAGKYVVRFNPDGGMKRYLYAWDTSKNYADQNSSDHANCAFTLEEVTELPVKMNTVESEGKSFATFSAPVGVTGVENADIYSIAIEGNQAVYTVIDDKQAPANTGLLLIGEAGTTEATITLGDVDATVETEMKPQIVCIEAATAKEENKLFLGTKSGKLGFYNLKSDGGKSGGFKAYIENPAAADGEAKGLILVADGDVTAIDNLQFTNDNSAIYDLQGRKIVNGTSVNGKLPKGVFIQNGRKVVVK